MTNIINLTPHIVRIKDEETRFVFVFEPDGPVPRVEMATQFVGHIKYSVSWGPNEEYKLNIPLVKQTAETVTGLPEPKANTILIVSRMVLEACPFRKDLVAPDTGVGSVVRDEYDQIYAVRRFVTN